ncbi:MAG: 3,4-dihydroxy-2-butanone-4-phosphate synthase [Chitinophagaceae bacterium]|nr:3,4-dihydroxy-2-butanone-4-phosphate synthase [Oligoflexus sp.]
MQTDQDKVIARVRTAIEAIKNHKMVIMVDDEDRENEGDLVMAADYVSAQSINFMAKEARGLICLPLDPEFIDRLKLPIMSDTTRTLPSKETAFTYSIEAREGISTGISAADRAHTVKVAIADGCTPEDIVIPGHIFPLKARKGGVLERAGHTEGSVDIAKFAGFRGAAVICEIMNDDGTMARMPDLEIFSKKHDLPIVAIADLIQYRLLHESMVHEVYREKIQTSHGTADAIVFRSNVDQLEHLALVSGAESFGSATVDVRVHTQSAILDAFGDRKDGSGYRFQTGLDLLSGKGPAAFIYLNQPQHSWIEDVKHLASDLTKKSDAPLSSRPLDLRLHGIGAQIIRALGIHKMRVHTTSPMVLKGLSGFGLEVTETNIITKSH